MQEVERAIKSHWSPPRATESKLTTVGFQILPDGNIRNLTVLKSSGLSVMDEAGLKAVKDSTAFQPLLDGTSDPVFVEFTLECKAYQFRKF